MSKNSEYNDDKKKHILSNVPKIVILSMFALVVMFATFASFTTQDSGDDQSRVASFSVEAVDASAWDYQLTELFCRYDISDDIDDPYYQYLAYKVDITSNSEVDVEYIVNGLTFDDFPEEYVDVYFFDAANVNDAKYPLATDNVTNGPALKGTDNGLGSPAPDVGENDEIVPNKNPFYIDNAKIYSVKDDVFGTTITTENGVEITKTTSAKLTDGEGSVLKGFLETNPTKGDDFYIIFRVDFVEYNKIIEASDREPDSDEFTYGEGEEADVYMQYKNDFEFDVDIVFNQVD